MLDKIRIILTWCAAVLVCTLPWLIAFDHGGVFPWSRWLTVSLMTIPLAISFLEIRFLPAPRFTQSFGLIAIFLSFALLSLLQLVSLPVGIVGLLSSGVASAWTEWLNPVTSASGIQLPGWIKTSVDPEAGWAYPVYFVTCSAFIWSGYALFGIRSRVLALFVLYSICGATHALMGLVQILTTPNETIFGVIGANPFGPFINSNNAAGLLLMGLAGSLGIFAWRISTTVGCSINEEGISLNTLFDMTNDRIALITVLSGFVSFLGIVATGSRGALAAAMCGFVISLGVLKTKGTVTKTSALLALIAICLLVLFFRFEVDPVSIDRFGAAANGLSQTVLSDGRWGHWSESLVAVGHYLPMGAGFGAYKYAYLPYQSNGSTKWFDHADNLWLEWTLEGGALAVVLLVLAITWVIRSLRHLRDSHDPMDQGIAVASSFAAVAVLISQTFDFGFLFTGNSATFCLLMGVLSARSALVAEDSRKAGSRRKIIFTGSNPTRMTYLFGAVLTCCLLPSIFVAHAEARADAKVRALAQTIIPEIEDAELLSIANRDDKEPWRPGLIAYHESRLLLLRAEQQVESILNQTKWYKEFSADFDVNLITRHRNLWRILDQPYGTNPQQYKEAREDVLKAISEAEPLFTSARERATASLMSQPLAPEPRMLFLWADLGIDSDPSKLDPEARDLCEQLFQLRRGSASIMDEVAMIAAILEKWDIALSAWKTYLTENPRESYRIFVTAELYGVENPLLAIPAEALTYSSLGDELVKQPDAAIDTIKVIYDYLSEGIPREKKYKIRRYQLLGRLAEKLEDSEASGIYIQKVIDVEPSIFEHRVRMVDHLKKIGRLREAKEYCIRLSEERPDFLKSLESMTLEIQKEIDRINKDLITPIPALIE